MKTLFLSLVLVSSVSVYSHATNQEFITLHTTRIAGLMNDEYQLIRTDITGWTDGYISQTGYQLGCESNGSELFTAKIFNAPGQAHQYEYNLTYSLCRSESEGSGEKNNCQKIAEIQVSATKNESDKIIVNLPEYSLDLSAISGQESPCQMSDIDSLSVLRTKN